MVVAHVRAFGGRRTGGDPPQPEQSNDVVDAYGARMAQHSPDQCTKRSVFLLLQPVRPPRRLRPVLAELIEFIGWRTRGHAQRQRILQGPRVGPIRMHADGQVMHDPQRHSRPHRLRLGRGELFVQLPLQPAMKINSVRIFLGETANTGTGGVLQETRPAMPVGAVLFGQRTPGGEVVERATFTLAEGCVGQLATRRARHPVKQLERLPLSRPCAVTVDAVELASPMLNVGPQPAHPATLGQVGIFGYGLNANIERVEETPGCGQIRRRFHRDRRGGRVQWIDQEVVSAMPGRRPYREIGQVGEIADTPRLSGPHAIELSGQAPPAAGSEPLRQPQPIRRNDQRCAGLEVRRTQMHAVIAQRQVARQQEGGLADPASVQIKRRGEVIRLLHPAPHRAVLELQPHLGGCAVTHMHPEPRRCAGSRDDGGWHLTCPIRPKMPSQSHIPVLLGAGGDAEGGEHSHQGRLGDEHLPAGPVHVPSGDAVSPGKFDQRGRELSHAAHLASRSRSATTRPAQSPGKRRGAGPDWV